MGKLRHGSHMTGWAIRWVERYNGKCWGISMVLWTVWDVTGE
jgi:hypothetical protein